MFCFCLYGIHHSAGQSCRQIISSMEGTVFNTWVLGSCYGWSNPKLNFDGNNNTGHSTSFGCPQVTSWVHATIEVLSPKIDFVSALLFKQPPWYLSVGSPKGPPYLMTPQKSRVSRKEYSKTWTFAFFLKSWKRIYIIQHKDAPITQQIIVISRFLGPLLTTFHRFGEAYYPRTWKVNYLMLFS